MPLQPTVELYKYVLVWITS